MQATSKGSDQTARVRRLIWGFAGRTYHIVWKSHVAAQLYSCCDVAVSDLYLFLVVPWVGL